MNKLNHNKKLKPHHQGFTLIELVIVLLILGALAAIIVPKISNYVNDAKTVSTFAQLKNIRSAFELYRTQHNNRYPALEDLQNNWGVMIYNTDSDGTINVNGSYGPYMQQAPKNPWTDSSQVLNFINSGDINDGWRYNENTGDIIAVGFDESTGKYIEP